MSQRHDKRFRKEVRREFKKEIGEGMEVMGVLLRQRPRWIPKQLWILLYVPIIKPGYIHLFYRHIP